jgi:hypothetical protein
MLGADIPDPLVSDPFCCGRCLTQAMWILLRLRMLLTGRSGLRARARPGRVLPARFSFRVGLSSLRLSRGASFFPGSGASFLPTTTAPPPTPARGWLRPPPRACTAGGFLLLIFISVSQRARGRRGLDFFDGCGVRAAAPAAPGLASAARKQQLRRFLNYCYY